MYNIKDASLYQLICKTPFRYVRMQEGVRERESKSMALLKGREARGGEGGRGGVATPGSASTPL